MKLLAAEQEVNVMKVDLIALQPVLVQTGVEVAETLIIVNRESQEASVQREVVVGEEAIANEKATAAQAIKDECEGVVSPVPGDWRMSLTFLLSCQCCLASLCFSDLNATGELGTKEALI